MSAEPVVKQTLLDIEEEFLAVAERIGDLEDEAESPIVSAERSREIAVTLVAERARLAELLNAESLKADAIGAVADRLRAQMEFNEDQAKRIRARAHRLERTRDRILRYTVAVMDLVGTKSLKGQSWTIDRRAARKHLEVLDPQMVPRRFWKQPEPVIDMTALAEAVKARPEVYAGVAEMIDGEPFVVVRH